MSESTPHADRSQRGRGWAYASLILMGAVSVLGNIAHMRMVTPAPGALDYVIAGGWPIGLFLAIEMFARLPWQSVPAHRAVRYGGLILVALLTGIVSYEHLSGLLAARGQSGLVAFIGPLAIDGIMAMATMGLVLTAARRVSQDIETPVRVPTPVPVRADTGQVPDTTPVPVSPVVSPAPARTPVLSVVPGRDTKVKPARRARGWDKDNAALLLSEGRTREYIARTLRVSTKTLSRHFPSGTTERKASA